MSLSVEFQRCAADLSVAMQLDVLQYSRQLVVQNGRRVVKRSFDTAQKIVTLLHERQARHYGAGGEVTVFITFADIAPAFYEAVFPGHGGERPHPMTQDWYVVSYVIGCRIRCSPSLPLRSNLWLECQTEEKYFTKEEAISLPLCSKPDTAFKSFSGPYLLFFCMPLPQQWSSWTDRSVVQQQVTN